MLLDCLKLGGPLLVSLGAISQPVRTAKLPINVPKALGGLEMKVDPWNRDSLLIKWIGRKGPTFYLPLKWSSPNVSSPGAKEELC